MRDHRIGRKTVLQVYCIVTFLVLGRSTGVTFIEKKEKDNSKQVTGEENEETGME